MQLLRLALLYFRVGALNELQYRVNFFVQLFQSAVALVVGLVGLALVFSHTTDLNGWSRYELLAVMGVHILMGGLINAIIQPNMQRLLGDIQEGTFDYTLTKPEDAQIIASVREFRVWQMLDVIMGLIVLGVALFQLQRDFTLGQIAQFIFVLLLGWGMIYSIWLMVTATAFWIIRVEQIVELFGGIYATGRWPVSIYPDWLRAGLTFIVPVAFAVTVPAEAITGRLTTQTLLLATGLAIAMLSLARFVWRRGLKAYSGASA